MLHGDLYLVDKNKLVTYLLKNTIEITRRTLYLTWQKTKYTWASTKKIVKNA